MQAIARSGIGPKKSLLYPRTPRCSIPLYDIATNLDMLDPALLKDAGKSIEQLGLSISTKVSTGATERPPRDPIACHDVAYAYHEGGVFLVCSLDGDPRLDDEKFDGLARFLAFTPNLESLDIHSDRPLIITSLSLQLQTRSSFQSFIIAVYEA